MVRQREKGHELSRKWIQVGLLIASVGCAGWAHTRLPIPQAPEQRFGFVPDPNHARALALGFDAILADYEWLRAVQVVGGAVTVDRDRASQLGQLVDVATTLNPHVDHPYRFAAIWLTNDEAQVREGMRLLRRATQFHPGDWRNHFYLGYAQFYYLGDFDEAAVSLERATALPGAPAYLPRLVARLKAQSGGIDVAEIFLREILRNTQDPEDSARIQIALDEIELERKARFLDRVRRAYKQLTGQDITSVDQLIRGPHRMLEKLPSPEPDAIPKALSRGSVWKLDRKTGKIVSSYLGRRYEVHYSGADRKRLEEWKQAKGQTLESGAEQ